MENIESMLKATPADSKTGYVLEVELNYPAKLHDEHSDYPLAHERNRIDPSMFSPFMKEHFHASDTEKLTSTLSDKERYTVHYWNLQLYLELGMEVVKVHRVLQFQQSPWLKQYIVKSKQTRIGSK